MTITSQRLTAISLFSGCGGLDLGLREAGFDFLIANELDNAAAESHRLNFPDVPLFEGSVASLTMESMAGLAPRLKSERVDLVAGGPPCPPFSKSRFYRKDMPRALQDPVGWETINGYLQVVRALKPRAFILENVPGLAYEVHQEALQYIMSEAEGLGYRTAWRILNAADYGVPQVRQRLFLVGLAGEGPLFQWPEATHGERPGDGLFTQSLSPWRTAGQAIGDLDTEELADDAGHVAGGKHRDLLSEVPPGDNYLYFTAERGHPEPKFRWRSRYWSFLLKLSPDRPAWTIQASRSSNMGPFHWRNRILRIGEIKRLQTFPDDWRLVGKVDQQWRMIGNAVPPALAKRLGQAMLDALVARDVALVSR